jgi:hypothetical protein
MRNYNVKPKPRALFIGFNEKDLNELKVEDLFPTYRSIEDTDQLQTLSQSEYEVIVCGDQDDLSGLDYDNYIVSLGGENLGWADLGTKVGVLHSARNKSVDTVFKVPEKLDERLRMLVESSLLPLYKAEASHAVLSSLSRDQPRSIYSKRAQLWNTLLADGHDNILAGYAKKSTKDHEQWYLHYGISMRQLNSWLTYLLKRWGELSTEDFPNTVEWKNRPEWQSSAEIAISNEIKTNEEIFAAAHKIYASQNMTLASRLEAAKTSTDSGYRLLLTAQADPLKDAVATILADLGFVVLDVDKQIETAEPGAEKLEDLRVSIALEGDKTWTAIAEVRGYSKGGAKTADLIRISGRFSKRYMAEHGKEPEALWYIVNHDFDKITPPDRHTALIEQPKDIKSFEEEHGAIIDTLELYKLYNMVDKGIITKTEAREKLMKASGTFYCPEMK